jgi:hypothetical protein
MATDSGGFRVAQGDGVAKALVTVPMVVGDDGIARGSAVVEGDGTGTRLPDADTSTIGPDATPLEAPTLAGRYLVVHGSFTLESRETVGPGAVIELSADEAEAALANGTVEALEPH